MNYQKLRELFFNDVFQEQPPTFGEDGRQHGLYVIQNTINGKFYMGKHSRKQEDSYFGSGVALGHAVRKYGKDNFQMKYFHWSENQEQLHLDESEVLEILLNEIFDGNWQELKKCSYNLKLNQGFNLFSDETLSKMSVAKLGIPLSAEHRENLSAARTGKKRPDSFKKINSARQSGSSGNNFQGIVIGVNHQQEVVAFNGNKSIASRPTREGKFFIRSRIYSVIKGQNTHHAGFKFFRTKSVDVLQNYLETATFYDTESKLVLESYLSSVAETS